MAMELIFDDHVNLQLWMMIPNMKSYANHISPDATLDAALSCKGDFLKIAE